VSSFQSHHHHTLPNGVVVDRLPLGFAAGRWWASFVYGVPDGQADLAPADWRHIGHSASVYDPDGLLDCVSGSGGGTG
jgi:hypothetical protein